MKKNTKKYALGGSYNPAEGLLSGGNQWAMGNPVAAGMSMVTGFLPDQFGTKEPSSMNNFQYAKMGAHVGSQFGPIGAGVGIAAGMIGDLATGKSNQTRYYNEKRDQNVLLASQSPNPYGSEGYGQVDPRRLMADGGPAGGAQTPPYVARDMSDFKKRTQAYDDSLFLWKEGEMYKKFMNGKWGLDATKEASRLASSALGMTGDEVVRRSDMANSRLGNPDPVGSFEVGPSMDVALYKKPVQKILPPVPPVKRESVQRMSPVSGVGSDTAKSPLPPSGSVSSSWNPSSGAPVSITPGFMDPRVVGWKQNQIAGHGLSSEAPDFANGGDINPPTGSPVRMANPSSPFALDQPMSGNFILPDPNRPRLHGSNATEYKIGVDGMEIPTIVGGNWLGEDGAIDRFRLTGERFKQTADPSSYSRFYDMVDPLGLMKDSGAYAQGGKAAGHVIPAENVGVAIQDAIRAGRSDVVRPAFQSEMTGGVIPGNGHPRADDKVMNPGGGDPIRISSGEMYVNDDVFAQMAASKGVDPETYGRMMYPNTEYGSSFANGGPSGSDQRTGGSRSWRNNNPGNIVYGSYARSAGATGTDGRFAIFPSYESGRSAQERLLFEGKNYRDLTMKEAISRWAPSFENDTASYISKMGGDPARKMKDYTPEERSALLDRMQNIEGWKEGNVSRAVAESQPTADPAPKVISATEVVAPVQVAPSLPEAVQEAGGDPSAAAFTLPQAQPLTFPMQEQNEGAQVAIASLKNGGRLPKYAGGGPPGQLPPVVGAAPRPMPWTPRWMESFQGPQPQIGSDGVPTHGPWELPQFVAKPDRIPIPMSESGYWNSKLPDFRAEADRARALLPAANQGPGFSMPGAGEPPIPRESIDRMDPFSSLALADERTSADLAGVTDPAVKSTVQVQGGRSGEPVYDEDALRDRNQSMLWQQLPFHVVAGLHNIRSSRRPSPMPSMIASDEVDYRTDAYRSELERQRQNMTAGMNYQLRGKSGVGRSLVAAEADSSFRRRAAADVQAIKNQEAAMNTQIRNSDRARNVGSMNEWSRYESASSDRDRAMRGQALGQNITGISHTLGTYGQNDLFIEMAKQRQDWNKWAREEVARDPARARAMFQMWMNP